MESQINPVMPHVLHLRVCGGVRGSRFNIFIHLIDVYKEKL